MRSANVYVAMVAAVAFCKETQAKIVAIVEKCLTDKVGEEECEQLCWNAIREEEETIPHMHVLKALVISYYMENESK